MGIIDALGRGAVPWGFGGGKPGESEIFVKLSIDCSCLESFRLTQDPKIFEGTINDSCVFH